MLLTDYFHSVRDESWDIAKQCGIKYGVIRLPEDDEFDVTNHSHWMEVHKRFTDFGITPIVIEPMPNALHDHIKAGDSMRDECIEKVMKMFPIMESLGIHTICFNFMAHIGWLRTASDFPERGGASVTGFRMEDFVPVDRKITEEELWNNYEYFIRSVIPCAERHGITLALHPDDPPVEKLGNVSRIMINAQNIERAVKTVDSESLGITMCQATYEMMGEDLYEVVPRFASKIKFIHFRNVKGNKYDFRETFHDNGEISMGEMIRLYQRLNLNVPIRVDHVPTLLGEKAGIAGYGFLGRLFAIGYLKGLLENA